MEPAGEAAAQGLADDGDTGSVECARIGRRRRIRGICTAASACCCGFPARSGGALVVSARADDGPG